MIEYESPSLVIEEDTKGNSDLLKTLVGDILSTMRNINRNSAIKFPEPPRLSDYDLLNLFCANLANKNITPNGILQYLINENDMLLKAETLL